MARPFLLFALFITIALCLLSCSNDSDSEISGPSWPSYEPVSGRWEWLNPQPTGNALSDVTFINTNTGWACGTAGTLLHTTDGGTDWTVQATGSTSNIGIIQFADAQHGWIASRQSGASGWTSQIRATANAGESWNDLPVATFSDLYITDLCYTDANNAWAVFSEGRIYHSASGNNWEAQFTDAGYSFSSVSFCDTQNGWAVGYRSNPRYYQYGVVLHTTNGGQSWARQDSISSQYPTSVFFYDALNGWLTTSEAEVWRTTDGGETWVSLIAEAYYYNFNRIHFMDLQHGWIRGRTDYQNYGYWLTSDGGISWTPGGQNAQGVCFVDAMTGWTVGSSGQIKRTDNGGANWIAQTELITGAYLWDTSFEDNLNGITVGNAATILQTTDGGISWMNRPTNQGTDVELHAIAHSSSSDLWIAGGSYSTAVILHSSDGGQSWNERTFGGMSRLTDIEFSSPSAGWAVGERGLILHSTDAGYTWNLESSGVSGDLRGITFSDEVNGWISGGPATEYGSGAVLLSTHDGGNTWTSQVFSGMRPLISVFALDAAHIWAVGESGVILHSGDGGQNWNVQNSPVRNSLWSILFLNPTMGWATGENGTLLSTIDGGDHWSALSTSCGNHFLGFDAIDAGHAWVVGQDGTIMRFVPYDIQ